MQIQKHITKILMIIILALGTGYIIVTQSHVFNSDEASINTGSNYHSLSKSDTGVEIDTGKRVETLANSSTNWGMSPFGSGKPLTEEEQKPEFKKPNIEWKTRTLSGITYVFGEGNPKEKAMSLEQISAMTKTCESNIDLSQKGICNVESGLMSYVTPEVEKYLLLALSDPNWSKLATECEQNFRAMETHLTPEIIAESVANNPTYLTFDRVFSSGFLDIDRFIFIEPTTGLKIMNANMLRALPQFLAVASYNGYRGDNTVNPYGDCVDRYGLNIVRNIAITEGLYKNPIEYVHGYTGVLLSKDFNFSQF